jgi:glycosyltransferase involved in cell wall biosynthesis
MTQPSVTVMMPCFNNSKYISAAVQSVLSQTHRDFELVIIDDASTDGSAEIVQSFHDPRIRLVTNKVNRGIAAVRNQLLELAVGRYLTSLDGDDLYCSKEKLAKEFAVLQAPQEATQPSIAFSDFLLIDAMGNVTSQASWLASPREGILFQGILERNIMIPRDFLMPATLAKAVGGFDENLALYEDWDYKLRLAQKGCFVYTNHIGIGYRRHGAGLSSASKGMHRHFTELIRRKYGIHGFERSAVDRLRTMMHPLRFSASTKAA